MLRKGLHNTSLGEIKGDCWTAVAVRFRGFDVLFISAYLQDTVGLGGANAGRLQEIAAMIRSLRIPFVIGADWNMTPEELDHEGWVTGIGATVRAPAVGATCTSGKGRMLDYFVASNELADRLEVGVDLDGPWAPHRGIRAVLKAGACAPMVWQLVEPRGIPASLGPDRTTFQAAFEEKVSSSPPAFALWDHPFEADSQSADLTRKYGAFSQAAEDTLLGSGVAAGEARHQGRGTPLTFRWASQQKPNRPGALYQEKGPSFWGALRQRLLEYRRFRNKVQTADPPEEKAVEN